MKLSIVYVPIDDLVPYVNNSKTHSDEQIDMVAASMKEFGFTNPVLTDGDKGIIAGHCRVLAARRLGLDEIPTLELSHLSESQKKAYVIADNRLAEIGSDWHYDLLSLELDDLKSNDFDLSLVGFDESFILEEDEGQADRDGVPEAPEHPVTVLGDIWELGPHRLICGDSTQVDTVAKLMGDQLADMLLTDPPYNVAYEGKTKDKLTIDNDSMEDSEFRLFLRDAFSAADIHMKPGGVFYIWHADSEGYNFRGACKDIDWQVRQCLIWQKQTMVMGRQDYHWKHEPCLYGWKSGAGHLWATDRKQTTLLEFDRPSRSKEHPTMKPVDLFEYQMLNNTKGKDIVLDLFGGSGTTLIAAQKNGRIARLVEFDPVYCDVIVKRWEEYTGQTATHLESGKTYAELSE